MNEFMQAASITVFKGNAMALVNDFLDKNFIKRPRLRRFITRLLEGDKETEVYLLGSKIRINSTKEHGYLRAHRASRSSSLLRDEIPIMITLANLLEDGDTFLDIGANDGTLLDTYENKKLIRIGCEPANNLIDLLKQKTKHLIRYYKKNTAMKLFSLIFTLFLFIVPCSLP